MIENVVLSPLTSAILLLLLLAMTWRWLPRALRWSSIGIEILLVVVMTPLGANFLVHAVESRVPATTRCALPHPQAIVVLSGGLDRPPASLGDFSAANAESLHRLFAGITLWRQTPGAVLIVAGGDEQRITQADLLAQLARELGVPAAAIRVERNSRTTWENARDVAAMTDNRRIWLVTSALHLPRALVAFRAFGFQPCAWSSGSLYLPPKGIGYFIPQSSALDKAEAAIHEIVGGWVYAWRARHAVANAKVQRKTS